MSIFKENKRISPTDTLIGQGTHVEGKLICEAGLRIEGEYRGDIECAGDVIIGESGIARSNITAKDLTVAGKLFGDITTKGRLTITATGQITGNINAHSLIIQDGGSFNGSSHMERGRHRSHARSPKQTVQAKKRLLRTAAIGIKPVRQSSKRLTYFNERHVRSSLKHTAEKHIEQAIRIGLREAACKHH